MSPPTLSDLLNDKDEAPIPAKLNNAHHVGPSISPVGIRPGVVPRLPSFSDLMSPTTPVGYNHAFSASPNATGLAQVVPYGPSSPHVLSTPSRPEEHLLALSLSRPPVLPPVTPLSVPIPLEPPTSTPISNQVGWNRYPFALGQLRPPELSSTPRNSVDRGRKRTRSEMEAAAALPELSTRPPLTSLITEESNREDRNQSLSPLPQEVRPIKKRIVSSATQGTELRSKSGHQKADGEDEVKRVAEPSTTAESRKKKKKDTRKRRRGPKNIPCPHCAVLFNQNSALISHVKTVHLGERRFVCPKEGCGQRFGASGDVTRHVDSVHLERRPYKCEDCGTMLSRKTVLYRHIRNVHKKEPKFLEPTPR